MKSIELNPKGNFNPWQPLLLAELNSNLPDESLGQEMVYENEDAKMWTLTLLPGERLPFRHVNCNFSFVTMDDGMLLTRSSCGRIGLHHLEKGDGSFFPLENSGAVYDAENIGEECITLHLLEFKSASVKTKPIFDTRNNSKSPPKE